MTVTPKPTWTVPCQLVRVVDGDTLIVRADLGWRVEIETAVRVDGINAAEVGTADGDAAREYLTNLLAPEGAGVLVSKALLGQFEKYGRVLADVQLPDAHGALVDVGPAMVAAGHAKKWDGKGVKP